MVAGKRRLSKVPELILLAFKLVKAAPLPVWVPATQVVPHIIDCETVEHKRSLDRVPAVKKEALVVAPPPPEIPIKLLPSPKNVPQTLVTLIVAGKRALPIVPELMQLAFKLVKLAPLPIKVPATQVVPHIID